MGINVDGKTLNHMRFADRDKVLIADRVADNIQDTTYMIHSLKLCPKEQD